MPSCGAAETTGGGDQAEQVTVDVGGAVGMRGLSELGMIQGVEVLTRNSSLRVR